MQEHLLLEPAELGRGHHAELVGEVLAEPLERPQRFHVATRAVRGQHQEGHRAFPERVLLLELLQLWEGPVVLTDADERVEAVLGRAGP